MINKSKKSKSFLTYVFRASWDGTGKSIKVRAPSEEKAQEKAERSKMVQGCSKLRFMYSYA